MTRTPAGGGTASRRGSGTVPVGIQDGGTETVAGGRLACELAGSLEHARVQSALVNQTPVGSWR
jgi:hypothetical protein